MPTLEELDRVIGADAYDATGEKLGEIKNVFVDDESARPAFLSVRTGLLGDRDSLVPASGATWEPDKVKVAFVKDEVTSAPEFDSFTRHIEPEEQREILEHYGMPYAGPAD